MLMNQMKLAMNFPQAQNIQPPQRQNENINPHLRDKFMQP
jgi:hypothetical protein